MTEDTKDPNTTVAAQNQAAAVSDPNAPQLSANVSAENSAASTLSSGASPSSDMSKTAPATESGDGVGELSTSTPAAALGGAVNLPGAASTVSGSNPNANAAASKSSEPQTTAAPEIQGNAAAAKADADFINDPASQQASLAGTSGKAPGTNDTGMATDVGVEKMSPATAANTGGNPGVDTPSVNVKTPDAVHPILYAIKQRTAELKAIVGNQEKTPWIDRALKDLHTFEDWVIQHFEELKRKI